MVVDGSVVLCSLPTYIPSSAGPLMESRITTSPPTESHGTTISSMESHSTTNPSTTIPLTESHSTTTSLVESHTAKIWGPTVDVRVLLGSGQ